MTDSHPPAERSRRRWLSYGLRGLMLLVLLLSLPMGWIARDVYRAQREAEVVAAVEKAGGYASYDYHKLNLRNEVPPPPGPWLLRKLFGEHIHAYVDFVIISEPQDTNEVVPMLVSCHRLEYLELHDVTLTDPSVETISQMPRLNDLALIGTSLSVEQFRQLSQVKTLKSITLVGATASDEYLQLLPQFPELEEVMLRETTITDNGLKSLGQLPKLTSLEIEQAPAVTKHGFAALADCRELRTLWIVGTSIDEGCVDTLQKLPKLDDVYISPDELEVEFYAWGCMRIDTLTPVKVNTEFMPICGTCGMFVPEKTGPRVIDVDAFSITIRRYDDDEVEDLPQ
ncbi:Leucine Rich repeats (2 copies) [Bremerella volcania]|uniref:Leucine Rich repeats (2 copies) n=1 Tax=Bremerella volcania TaxID=2527984 RepID=A0A518CGC0_9BACT|nr:hypothetical protein [Bremerella volcania]QDU78270.1 Leucine Rich repeats (2 copies) [Bremerella volcania]